MGDGQIKGQTPPSASGSGWGATVLFLGTAVLVSTCTAGLAVAPLIPPSPDAQLLGQRQTPVGDVLVLMAFLLPMCAVFWRATWVANGVRKGVEHRFLSPAMGWFVAIVFGLPSAGAFVFALLGGDATASQLAMAACAVMLFGGAPVFAKRLSQRPTPVA